MSVTRMRYWALMPVLLVLLILLQTVVFAGPEPAKTRRFAFLIGANDGGPGRVKLRYSVSDAAALVKVLNNMGGVAPEDTKLLSSPNRFALFREMETLAERIKEARKNHPRVEVIVYYSGHSDNKHILLGGQKVTYGEFRRAINNLEADVRIAILDSCASGAFTRLKGGKKAPPFLVDSAYDMKGYAFMTSSSSNESSQESDQLAASFFTHNLIAGMRGAADMTGDGKITLNEAYQFAFNETLAQTEDSLAGPQHPNYNIQMSGTGDVVMTDVRQYSTLLEIGEGVSGKLFIRDNQEKLVVELNKPLGRRLELGLEKGDYKIMNIRDEKIYTSSIVLEEGKMARLAVGDLEIQERLRRKTRGKGKGKASEIPPVYEGYDVNLLDFSFLKTSTDAIAKSFSNVSLFAVASRSSRLDGVGLGLGVAVVDEDSRWLQFAGIGNITKGSSTGVQWGGIFNVAAKEMNGAQIAGIFNRCGHGQGFQHSTLFNVARASFNGIQMTGLLNYAYQLDGFQVGTINVVRGAGGGQVGLVNVAGHLEGLQLGLFNITKENDGLSFGLFNLVLKGETYLSICADELGFFNVSIKHGNEKFYNLYQVGSDASMKQGMIGWGYGLNFKLSRKVFMNLDGILRAVYPKEDWFSKEEKGFMLTGRCGIGVRFLKRFALIGGVSYNYFNNQDHEGITLPDPLVKVFLDKSGGKDRHWFGMFLQLDIPLQ